MSFLNTQKFRICAKAACARLRRTGVRTQAREMAVQGRFRLKSERKADRSCDSTLAECCDRTVKNCCDMKPAAAACR